MQEHQRRMRFSVFGPEQVAIEHGRFAASLRVKRREMHFFERVADRRACRREDDDKARDDAKKRKAATSGMAASVIARTAWLHREAPVDSRRQVHPVRKFPDN